MMMMILTKMLVLFVCFRDENERKCVSKNSTCNSGKEGDQKTHSNYVENNNTAHNNHNNSNNHKGSLLQVQQHRSESDILQEQSVSSENSYSNHSTTANTTNSNNNHKMATATTTTNHILAQQSHLQSSPSEVSLSRSGSSQYLMAKNSSTNEGDRALERLNARLSFLKNLENKHNDGRKGFL